MQRSGQDKGSQGSPVTLPLWRQGFIFQGRFRPMSSSMIAVVLRLCFPAKIVRLLSSLGSSEVWVMEARDEVSSMRGLPSHTALSPHDMPWYLLYISTDGRGEIPIATTSFTSPFGTVGRGRTSLRVQLEA